MRTFKVILGGAVLCVLGAVALDCGLKATGTTLIGLGCFGILFGPRVVDVCF